MQHTVDLSLYSYWSWKLMPKIKEDDSLQVFIKIYICICVWMCAFRHMFVYFNKSVSGFSL